MNKMPDKTQNSLYFINKDQYQFNQNISCAISNV
jgi:hypothetical protein